MLHTDNNLAAAVVGSWLDELPLLMCGRKPVIENLKEVDRILETPFSVMLTSANFMWAQTDSSEWKLVLLRCLSRCFSAHTVMYISVYAALQTNDCFSSDLTCNCAQVLTAYRVSEPCPTLWPISGAGRGHRLPSASPSVFSCSSFWRGAFTINNLRAKLR